MVVAPVRESVGEEMMGWIAACLLAGLMIPLMAMLYLDILDAKHQVSVQLEKVEKLRRQIEAQQRKGNKDD